MWCYERPTNIDTAGRILNWRTSRIHNNIPATSWLDEGMQSLHMECRHGNNRELVSAFREVLQVPQVPSPVSIPKKSVEGMRDIAVGIFPPKSSSCCVVHSRPAEVTYNSYCHIKKRSEQSGAIGCHAILLLKITLSFPISKFWGTR